MNDSYLLKGRGPSGEFITSASVGDEIRRTVNADDEVLRTSSALRELVAGDLDHVVIGVGINILKSVFADGGNELLVEEEPDIASGIGRRFAYIDDEVRRSVREGEVVVDEFTRGKSATSVLRRRGGHRQDANVASGTTPTRRADARATVGSTSILAVSRISDRSNDDRVVTAAVTVNTDVPCVESRGGNINATTRLERIILVIILENGGALVLANVNIAIAIGNGARCQGDTHRVR